MNNEEFMNMSKDLIFNVNTITEWNLEAILVKIERQRILNLRKEKLKKIKKL